MAAQTRSKIRNEAGLHGELARLITWVFLSVPEGLLCLLPLRVASFGLTLAKFVPSPESWSLERRGPWLRSRLGELFGAKALLKVRRPIHGLRGSVGSDPVRVFVLRLTRLREACCGG